MMEISPANQIASFLSPGQLDGRNFDLQQTASQARDFSINIQTREGDVVTISGADLHSLAVSAGPGALSADAVAAGSRSSSIQGDLNERELADIRTLLHDLTSIAAHFFAGRFDQALAKAGRMGGMGASLSSLDASFSRSISSSHILALQPGPASFREAAAGVEPGMPEPGRQSPPDFLSRLGDRWQQIRKVLPEIESRANAAGRLPCQHHSQAARHLFLRAIEYLPGNPRMAPLLPAMNHEAVLQAGSLFPPDVQTAAARLQHEFNDLFRSWLLTS